MLCDLGTRNSGFSSLSLIRGVLYFGREYLSRLIHVIIDFLSSIYGSQVLGSFASHQNREKRLPYFEMLGMDKGHLAWGWIGPS